MPIIHEPRERYDPRTIRLHWLTAILVAALWSLGQTIDWFPKGLPRTAARSTHISLGFALTAVIIYRLWWRATEGRRLPPSDRGWLGSVATAIHRVLYLCLCATVLLGIANAWLRGDNLFNLVAFPIPDPRNQALRGLIESWHGLSANALLVVAAVHAGAGLMHRFVLRDGVLSRMT